MMNEFYTDKQTSTLKLCPEGSDDGEILGDTFNFRDDYPDCAAPI